MSRAMRFTLGLVLGLALVTWGASVIVQRTTRNWFEKDISLRAQLAVNGARRALISHWHNAQRRNLEELLSEITHDERILAAAACGRDLSPLASTADFPTEFGCRTVGSRVRPSADSPATPWETWKTVSSLPGGTVHVSAIPVVDGQ